MRASVIGFSRVKLARRSKEVEGSVNWPGKRLREGSRNYWEINYPSELWKMLLTLFPFAMCLVEGNQKINKH